MVQQPPPSISNGAHVQCWVNKSHELENEAWVLETKKNEFVSGEKPLLFPGINAIDFVLWYIRTVASRCGCWLAAKGQG